MSAHLIRLFEAFSLLVPAIVLVAGILSTHSLAPTHSADDASLQSAPIAEVPSENEVEADACDVLSTPQCCIEPVECVERVTLVPAVLAALTAPALTHSTASVLLPPRVDDQARPQAPSLVLLSISRT